MFTKLLFAAALVAAVLPEIFGHGMLMEPVNRGSAWRKGFKTPPNYDDSGNYCGGYTAHFVLNKGKCGACGDNYAQKQPRRNENGGLYGTGTIVRTYTEGQEFEADVALPANHMGYFKFAICPLKHEKDIETEECFEKFPVKLADGQDRYTLKTRRTGSYKIKLVLPKGLTCNHCSLRWHYKTANAWNVCENGTGKVGCGNQETFRTCSDIRIVSK